MIKGCKIFYQRDESYWKQCHREQKKSLSSCKIPLSHRTAPTPTALQREGSIPAETGRVAAIAQTNLDKSPSPIPVKLKLLIHPLDREEWDMAFLESNPTAPSQTSQEGKAGKPGPNETSGTDLPTPLPLRNNRRRRHNRRRHNSPRNPNIITGGSGGARNLRIPLFALPQTGSGGTGAATAPVSEAAAGAEPPRRGAVQAAQGGTAGAEMGWFPPELGGTAVVWAEAERDRPAWGGAEAGTQPGGAERGRKRAEAFLLAPSHHSKRSLALSLPSATRKLLVLA